MSKDPQLISTLQPVTTPKNQLKITLLANKNLFLLSI